jgi:hypothetical protein
MVLLHPHGVRSRMGNRILLPLAISVCTDSELLACPVPSPRLPQYCRIVLQYLQFEYLYGLYVWKSPNDSRFLY